MYSNKSHQYSNWHYITVSVSIIREAIIDTTFVQLFSPPLIMAIPCYEPEIAL